MQTLLAAATIAASIAGNPHTAGHHIHTISGGFAPAVHNRLLVTPPPSCGQSSVYTTSRALDRARVWAGIDHRSSHRSCYTPGRAAYGAMHASGDERVHVRVYNQVVSISPWQRVEGEGWSNFEAARQQWLKERGYTGAVRTIVSPARTRALASGAETAATRQVVEPSATIRLRNERGQTGTLREVRAGTPVKVRITRAGTETAHASVAPSMVVKRAKCQADTTPEVTTASAD